MGLGSWEESTKKNQMVPKATTPTRPKTVLIMTTATSHMITMIMSSFCRISYREHDREQLDLVWPTFEAYTILIENN